MKNTTIVALVLTVLLSLSSAVWAEDAAPAPAAPAAPAPAAPAPSEGMNQALDNPNWQNLTGETPEGGPKAMHKSKHKAKHKRKHQQQHQQQQQHQHQQQHQQQHQAKHPSHARKRGPKKH